MKKSTVVLVVSLLANGALLAVFLARGIALRAVPLAAVGVAPRTPEAEAKLSSAQLAALAAGDAAALKAAGFPEETARQLAVGRAYARMQARMSAMKNVAASRRDYWSGLGSASVWTPQRWKEVARDRREFDAALREAFGEEASEVISPFSKYAFLPAAKRDRLLRIERDYAEMQNEVSEAMRGFQLPADDEKFKLLAAEKQRDIMAALTPEEREQFELRESPLAFNLRSKGIRSEADYLKIFALQKAFDDRYGSVSQDGLVPLSAAANAERKEAAPKLREDLHAALGDDGYAALRRKSDDDYRMLNAMARRFEIPAATVEAVYDSRDRYAGLSQRISRDAALSPEARSKQLQALAERARADLQTALGAEAAELYATRADWLATLKDGRPVSTELTFLPGGLYIQEPRVAPIGATPAEPVTGSPPKG